MLAAGGCAAAGAAGAALAAALQFFVAAHCALREPWPPAASLRNGSCFDFIVVGGGTAGCTLAARLAGRPGRTVLLLEAGPDPPAESIIPGFSQTLRGGPYDWNLTAEDDGRSSQALRGGRQAQPRARLLGGCGSVNHMVYACGFPADYDRWADTLGDHWSWTNVLRYFKKTEHLTDERIVDDPQLMELHGRGGEIEVAGLNASTFETDRFLEALEELRFKMVKDMTSPRELGAGRPSHTVRAGRRASSLTALLNKAGTNKNLFVFKNAFVTKILISNNTAYGVKVLLNNKLEFHLYASEEVLVSAGTFHTPQLLMLSGVGPKHHLEEFGIEVVADLPVGQILHDHVMVLSYLAAAPGTCPVGAAARHTALLRYLLDGGGPLAHVDTVAAYMALNGSTTPNVPDFAFYPSCIPVGAPFWEPCSRLLRFNDDICRTLHELLRDRELLAVAAVLLQPRSRGQVRLSSADPADAPLIYSGTFSDRELLAVAAVLLQPRSRGQVRLSSADPADAPLIYSGTFSDPSDLDGYPQALQVVESIATTSYFKSKNATLVRFDIEVCRGLEGVERVRCAAQAVAMSAWHSAGTAAMGAVLDGRLRVRGVRVVDASAMPRVVRGNTNAPVVMLAEQAADFIGQAAHNHDRWPV